MLEDIDDWNLKWANQCEPIREKCITCDNIDCSWWSDFNEDEDEEDEFYNGCRGCKNFRTIDFLSRQIEGCMANMNPRRCILNKQRREKNE